MRRVVAVLMALLMAAWAGGAGAPDRGKARTQAAVAIRGKQFSPPVLTIKAGQTVVWTNYDDVDHIVVAADGSFASATLKKGQAFAQAFLLPGKYGYMCKLHPREKGVITVE